jgi:tRNA 2-selenouridine synthase
MPIQKITIEEFLKLAQQHPVLDVRSPGEYTHAHIPGAINLPLFTDEERKVVGTVYKQQSKQTAIKIGLDYFGAKMRLMVEQAEAIISHGQLAISKKQKANNSKEPLPIANCLLVHCWRGGMRSAGVAWLLDLYGFKVYTLAGGYKAYRKWVREQFEKDYPFTIIGGYTGSGKTLILQEMVKEQKLIIDLEALANHKGSAFGALGENPQPKQEMFENLLAQQLAGIISKMRAANSSTTNNDQQLSNNIYIEDESQRIGNLQIPMPLWYTIRKKPIYFLDIPFEERLHYLTNEYGKFEKEKLVNAIIRIQKRLGGLETKNAVSYLLENNHKECFRILLTYYDKYYYNSLNNRENLSLLLNKIPSSSVDSKTNTQKILSCSSIRG